MAYYLVIKRNRLLIDATMWMNLQSQTKCYILCDFIYFTFGRGRMIGTVIRLVVARAGMRGRLDYKGA